MSKQSTSRSPASAASSSAPPTPPAGPESTVSAAWAAARARSVSPPEDCITCGSGSPAALALACERVEVAGEQRRERGVERRSSRCARTRGRCRRARGERDGARRAGARRAARRAGARARGRRRSAAARRRPLRARARASASTSVARGRRARARAARASGAHALGRAEAQLVGDERRRRGVAEPVEVRPRLAPELDDVGEAVGRDQRGARGAPLEQRVGRDGHAVGEALDVRGAGAGALRARRATASSTPCACSRGRRRDLGGVDGGVVADEHGVGEGAADVDSEEHAPEPTRRLRGGELAVLGFGEVLVGRAVAVVRQRHALAGGALARRRATLRRLAADGGVAPCGWSVR